MKRRAAFLLTIALFVALVPLIHHHGFKASDDGRAHEAACVLSILSKSLTTDVAVPDVAETDPDSASLVVASVALPASADVLASSSPRAPPSFSI